MNFRMAIPESSALRGAFEHQDEIFAHAFSILRQAIADRAFPGSSVAITYQGRLIALKALGNFTYEPSSLPVTSNTLFDLASVTKVVATTTMAMILFERGKFDFDTRVAAIIPEFVTEAEKDARRERVTLRMLLTHSSGLPAYVKLFLQANSRNQLLQAAYMTPLTADPATRAEYSDIGFIILGAALERIAGEPLDAFCLREVFHPLNMPNTIFIPAQEIRASIPPTADERPRGAGAPAREIHPPEQDRQPHSTFRQKVIQGEVQDENAYTLGGIAGHAGLFSTALDLARFAHSMLKGGDPILRPETVAAFTSREATPAGTSRALGWDTPSPPSQSGKYFSPSSFGHLGYTGTSLWLDPTRQLSVTLLTNRTWPDCFNQQIKIVRPLFHDAVLHDAMLEAILRNAPR